MGSVDLLLRICGILLQEGPDGLNLISAHGDMGHFGLYGNRRKGQNSLLFLFNRGLGLLCECSEGLNLLRNYRRKNLEHLGLSLLGEPLYVLGEGRLLG